jgi:hypothetical protein
LFCKAKPGELAPQIWAAAGRAQVAQVVGRHGLPSWRYASTLLHDHETVKDTLCGDLQAAISGILLASKRVIMLLKMDWHSSANRALLW